MNFRIYFLPLVIIIFLSSCTSSSSEPLILSEQQEKNTLNEYKDMLEKKKYEEAYKKLLILENVNNISSYAKNEIGNFYENGIYVDKNLELALKYYVEAGNKNYIPAIYNVGRVRLEQGHYTEAASIFKTIENDNFAPALNLIGVMYNYGYGYDVDLGNALKYYKKAALLGNPDAQFNIGQMYFKGNGGNGDFKEAFKWYTLSANQNYSLAKIQLATLYFKGYGVEANINTAINIIKPLAIDGHPDAIYNLRLYYKKLNNSKDYEYWDKVCKKNHDCDI
ncbi:MULTISPECIES: tetratricopeptide repeat protein [unclassified Acinetobacter]|uniref:tetratricopeptide repeat protein n=1 Tax=unclassified Acinetobacter TaxID=196816 RepID=UPI0015D2817F|nr:MULTISPECIES: tetratricopeptide repeat protein [unclassified Acinetobacter]